MTSPNSTFTEMVTTTLREHPSEIADNVSNHNALYRRLKSKGGIKKLDGGTEIVEGSLPAVITAQRGLNEPRYASLKGIMAAKKKPIEEVEAAPAPAAARVSALALPPARPEGRKLDGEAAAQAAQLLDLLKHEAKVL